jgi:hypothetical protein
VGCPTVESDRVKSLECVSDVVFIATDVEHPTVRSIAITEEVLVAFAYVDARCSHIAENGL